MWWLVVFEYCHCCRVVVQDGRLVHVVSALGLATV